jgi:hypothetical protein
MHREKWCEKILRSGEKQGRLAKGYRLVTFDSVLIHRQIALVFAFEKPGASMQISRASILITSSCCCG